MSNNQLEIIKKWLKENGVILNDELIEIVDSSNPEIIEGLGIVSKKDLVIDDIVAIIPKSCILSSKTTKISNYLEQFGLVDATATSIALMYEASIGSQSIWYGYIQSMPSVVDLPILWDNESIEFLKGTDLNSIVYENIKTLEDTFNDQVKPMIDQYLDIFNTKVFNLQNFKIANTIVSSRAFSIDRYHGESLVPLADIFNHKTGRENVHVEADGNVCKQCGQLEGCIHRKSKKQLKKVKDDEDEEDNEDEFKNSLKKAKKDSLTIRIVRPVNNGNEVFNTYGDHDNSLLLCKYGFLEMDNPCDLLRIDCELVDQLLNEYKIKFGIDQSVLDDRLEFYGKMFDIESREHHAIDINGHADDALITSLYIVLSDSKTYQRWKSMKQSIFYKSFEKKKATDMVIENQLVKSALINILNQRLNQNQHQIPITLNNNNNNNNSRLNWSNSLRLCENTLLLKSLKYYQDLGIVFEDEEDEEEDDEGDDQDNNNE